MLRLRIGMAAAWVVIFLAETVTAKRRWFTVYRNGLAIDGVKCYDSIEAVAKAEERNPWKDEDFMEVVVASHHIEVYTAKSLHRIRNEENAAFRKSMQRKVAYKPPQPYQPRKSA